MDLESDNMSKQKTIPLFAIVRLDGSDSLKLQDRIYVTKILVSYEQAEKEAARLNQVNSDKQCVYFPLPTRISKEEVMNLSLKVGGSQTH